MRKFVSFMTLIASFLAAGSALADPPDEPAGVNATYHVTVDHHWSGTGVAISREGWVMTTADIIGSCPDAPATCGIWVEDPARRIWLHAVLVASDPGIGIALLHTDGSFPDAASLASRRINSEETALAPGSGSNGRRPLTDDAREQPLVTVFGDPPASGQVVVTTLECPTGSYGTGVFAISDEHMVGMLVGTVNVSATADAGRTVAVPSGTVRAFYELHRSAYERHARATRTKR